MSKLKSQHGQGLLEAVFAIGILLMVAGAILALATANTVGQKASEFQIRANNLAREGIEVVRSIRDANWLAGEDWDTGLIGQTAVAQFQFDPVTYDSTWQLDFTPGADDTLYLDLSTGVHSHSAGGQRTVFQRTIAIEEICLDTTTGEESIETTCVGQDKIGLRVTSTVAWPERGRNNEISLEDLLYAWK